MDGTNILTTVASQLEANRMMNRNATTFIKHQSITLNSREFVRLMDRSIGRLLDVKSFLDPTEGINKKFLRIQHYPPAPPESRQLEIALLSDHVTGSLISWVLSHDVHETFFLFHSSGGLSHTFSPNGIINAACHRRFINEEGDLFEIMNDLITENEKQSTYCTSVSKKTVRPNSFPVRPTAPKISDDVLYFD